jgi:hypothetical protein
VATSSNDYLLNKRHTESVEFQFKMTTSFQSSGWRMVVGAGGGRLVVKFASGGTMNVDVAEGDVLFATGEDIYLQRKVA